MVGHLLALLKLLVVAGGSEAAPFVDDGMFDPRRYPGKGGQGAQGSLNHTSRAPGEDQQRKPEKRVVCLYRPWLHIASEAAIQEWAAAPVARRFTSWLRQLS